MKHLKPHQYYIDLYDRHTVEECRRIEESFVKKEDPPPPDDVGGVSPERAKRIMEGARKWYLHMECGERYLKKSTRIREWMDSDRSKDELLESAQAPEGIRCLSCRNIVKPTFKDLWSSDPNKPERVLFMYDCPNQCTPRRAFFSDGEEWRVKPDLCPRCAIPVMLASEDDGKKLITTRTCAKCGHKDVDEYEWPQKKDDEYDPNFAADRDRFCYTDEEGAKYRDEKWRWEQLGKLVNEFKEEEKRRAEKLIANPKGFHLDGVGYRCAICHNHTTEEGDNWYDEYGIKCLVCQKAIDEGEIPASLAKDEESWYSTYDLDHYFNLKHMTLKKWIKEGIIKQRIVSRYGQGVHVELFLIEDNKGFLPPKEMLKSHSVEEIKDGKTWSHSEPWYQFVDPMEYLRNYGIIKHMRVVPPEEIAAREAEKKHKWEEKQARKERLKLSKRDKPKNP